MLVHTTQKNVQIHVEPGIKSKYDFKVRFLEPGKKMRTPTHVHPIVELYVKQAFNRTLTNQLVTHLLAVNQRLQPITQFPPTFQVFKLEHAAPFAPLDAVGEFSAEFLLAVSELIFIQEKTNYPQGSLTQRLYQDFLTKDRFSVVHQATWKNR